MTENTTTQSNDKSNSPAKGTHWSNLDAMSSHRLGSTGGSDKDWTKWIEENKNMLLVAAFIVVVAVFGGGYLYNSKNSSKEVYNNKISTFLVSDLEAYKTSGNDAELLSKFTALHKETGDYIGLVPAAIKTADLLMTQGKKEKALEFLTIAKSISNNDYAQYFINTRLAVIFEDLGKNQEAVDVLTKLSSSDVKVFEGKVYLDLGRVYLKLGNKEKAKASFQYVVDKAKDDAEFVKIAKLQLANL